MKIRRLPICSAMLLGESFDYYRGAIRSLLD